MGEVAIALLVIASLPPYAVGYVAGVVVRVATWVWAATKAGYRKGRGK